ncbi:Xenobiotic-transporting ATPase [Forsythia ovata]|uniref:Xenobiotic-transporting ATPase n=1 Tax=Forsythia ovata TaxID=205694 RepID=A0ABD1PHR3_9LAMI
MKDGRITQDGKYNYILKSGSDFMELVGAHKEALSALDSIEAGAVVVGEDSSTRNAKNFLQKKESPTDQNDKTDNAMGTNGHFGNRLSMLVYQAVADQSLLDCGPRPFQVLIYCGTPLAVTAGLKVDDIVPDNSPNEVSPALLSDSAALDS